MNKPKVLVTGSSGFLGSAVMNRLKQNSDIEPIGLAGKQFWDLTSQKYVDYAISQFEPDYVIHLAAACGGIGINREQPGRFLYDNLSMGMNLIETCRKYNRLKKFIMVGTVCSYPKFTPVPFKEEDLWNGYPEETNAPYGVAKKTLMEMLIAYKKQYNMDSANLIPVNMYGPNDNFNPASSHVIPAIILKIDQAMQQNQKEVELWGTGQASREFLYVEDCADAICKSITAYTGSDPINIGTCSEIKICNLAKIIAKKMGYSGRIIYNDSFPDGQPRRCLDVSKAKKILGFEARTPLEIGIGKTIAWYTNNRKKFTHYFDNV